MKQAASNGGSLGTYVLFVGCMLLALDALSGHMDRALPMAIVFSAIAGVGLRIESAIRERGRREADTPL